MRRGIIYICKYGASYPGSFIASMEKLAAAARSEGICVYFLFPDSVADKPWIRALPVEDAHLLFCDFSFRGLHSFCRRFVRSHSSMQMVAHTHFLGGISLLAVKTCFDTCICHYHMSVPRTVSLVRRMRRVVSRMIYRGCILIGVSDAVSRDLKSFFPHNTVECVPNAVGFEYLSRSLRPGAVPACLDVDEFRILIHGSYFYLKGADTAVRAVAQLNKKQVPCRLYITTHSVDDTSRLLASLGEDLSMIQPIGVVENVLELYNNVELFLSPSREESFGYAVVEAAYSNCQVIASDVPGQNTLKQIPGIRWVQPDNAEELEKAILESITASGSEQARKLKSEQRDYVTAHYNVDSWVSKVLEIYHKYL